MWCEVVTCATSVNGSTEPVVYYALKGDVTAATVPDDSFVHNWPPQSTTTQLPNCFRTYGMSQFNEWASSTLQQCETHDIAD